MKDMFLSRWNRSCNSNSKTCPVRDSMLVKRMSAPKATSHRDVMLSWNLVCKFHRQHTAPTARESDQGYGFTNILLRWSRVFALITVPGSLPENDEYPKFLLIPIN